MNDESKNIYTDPIMEKALREQRDFSRLEMVGKSLYATSLIPLSVYVKDIAFALYEAIKHSNSEIPGHNFTSDIMLGSAMLFLVAGGIITSQARRYQRMGMIETIYRLKR